MLVGDTGFEPVTSSVLGQNVCLGMRGSGVPGAWAGSLMSACAGRLADSLADIEQAVTCGPGSPGVQGLTGQSRRRRRCRHIQRPAPRAQSPTRSRGLGRANGFLKLEALSPGC